MTRPVHVCWPRGRGFWDMGLLETLFQQDTAHNFVHHVAPYRNPPYNVFDPELDVTDGVVVVLPARHCVGHQDMISEWLAPYAWSLLLVMGDEESIFDARLVKHPNIRRWQQLPKPGVHGYADRFIINGYPGPAIDYLAIPRAEDRPLDWFFSGQVTHVRREQCFATLSGMTGGFLAKTEGFTQGEPHAEYYRHMTASKVIPCPSGARMPDSFRVAEALEAGCIPVVDGLSPDAGYPRGYWRYVLGEEPPFPVIENWTQFPAILKELLVAWPNNARRVNEWWSQYKTRLACWLREDIDALREKNV